MTIQPTEYERPTWRQVNVDKLAQRLYAAYWKSDLHGVELTLPDRCEATREKWQRVAEAAVDLLIDEPEKEFQAQLEAILGAEVTDPQDTGSQAAREWREASASDWLPERVEGAV